MPAWRGFRAATRPAASPAWSPSGSRGRPPTSGAAAPAAPSRGSAIACGTRPRPARCIAFDRPEILETDLARLALDLARWGARDPEALAFLDRPPPGAMAEARALLTRLGALDGEGALTRHGTAMGDLPLPPRLAHMVLVGAAAGHARRAARIAALIAEPGLGGRDVDAAARLEAFERDRGPRGRAVAALADRWAGLAERTVRPAAAAGPANDGRLIAEAFPERIARARGGPGEFQLASGRGAFVDPADALARESWLAVADLGGGTARDRILLAARLDEADLRTAFAGRLSRERRLEPGPGGGLRIKEILSLGELTVSERLVADPDPAVLAAALLDQVRREGLGRLAWGAQSLGLRARLEFLRARDPAWPDVSDTALLGRLDDWLAPLLAGRNSLASIDDQALHEALLDLLPWGLARRLDAEAPKRWTAPTGSSFAIDYAAPGGARVEVRVQELFGLNVHPRVAGAPLTLALLSPAHRPIQMTRDLPGFWRGSWSDVRKDMRGRYPKHSWPDDPATAAPTTRAKPKNSSDNRRP